MFGLTLGFRLSALSRLEVVRHILGSCVVGKDVLIIHGKEYSELMLLKNDWPVNLRINYPLACGSVALGHRVGSMGSVVIASPTDSCELTPVEYFLAQGWIDAAVFFRREFNARIVESDE